MNALPVSVLVMNCTLDMLCILLFRKLRNTTLGEQKKGRFAPACARGASEI